MHNAAVLFLPFVSRLSLRDQNHAIRLCAASSFIAPGIQIIAPKCKSLFLRERLLPCWYAVVKVHEVIPALQSIAAKSFRYSLSPYSDDKMDEVALRYPKIF